jgi:hypothetical protein
MSRKRVAVVLGLTLLFISAAGIASASIPDGGGVIHGCYKPASNGGLSSLGVVDTAGSGGQCPANQTALAWNQSGPQGPAGPAGATGATGPQGPAGTAGTSTSFYFTSSGPFNLPPNGGSSPAVGCNTGDTVIGGGGRQTDTTDGLAFIQGSFPTADNRWEVQAWNSDPVKSYSLTVYAECEHQG